MSDLTREILEELRTRLAECIGDAIEMKIDLKLDSIVVDGVTALTIQLREDQRTFLSLLTDLTPDLIAAAEWYLEGRVDAEGWAKACRLAHFIGRTWAEEHVKDDHTVVLDHKDKVLAAELVIAVLDAARAKGE